LNNFQIKGRDGVFEHQGAFMEALRAGRAMRKRIFDTPQQAMWSPDTEREPVPVTSDAERPVPTARRNVAGGTGPHS
jgi:hypothetical protein